MSKYSKYQNLAPVSRPWAIHPVWQGIGCILLVLIPILSFIGTGVLLDANQQNHYFPVSPDLAQPVDLSKLSNLLPGLQGFVQWTQQFSKIELMLTFGIIVLTFAILIFGYSLIYSMMGPSRYSPLDAPEIKRRGKKRKLH